MANNVIVCARPASPSSMHSLQLGKPAERELQWPVLHGPLFAKPREVPGPKGVKTYFASRVSAAFSQNPLSEGISKGSPFSYVLSIGSRLFKAEIHSEIISIVHLEKGQFVVLETPARFLLEANQLLRMAIGKAISNLQVEMLSNCELLPAFVEGIDNRRINYSESVLLVVPRPLNPSEGFRTYAGFLRQAAEFASDLNLSMHESVDTEGWSNPFGVGVHA